VPIFGVNKKRLKMKKIKKVSHSLKSDKEVYYYDHRNGVLANKAKSRMQVLSGLLTAVFVFGGIGFAVTKFVDLQNQKSFQSETTVGQMLGTSTDGSKPPQEDLNKPTEDDALTKEVKDKLKSIPGGQKWSVYVRDLKSSKMVSVNSDKQLEAGTLGHLFLTAPLEAKLPSNNWTWKAGNTTVYDCVVKMIKANDADCAQSVSYYADMKAADGVLSGFGFKDTTLENKKSETSAQNIGDLLWRLQNGQVLSDKGRRAVFDGLYAQKSREGIPAGCDQKCLIANITGESGEYRHDAAIVTSGDAKYVIVVMTNGGSWNQIADVASTVRGAMQP
jgi:beta-lactamase class A